MQQAEVMTTQGGVQEQKFLRLQNYKQPGTLSAMDRTGASMKQYEDEEATYGQGNDGPDGYGYNNYPINEEQEMEEPDSEEERYRRALEEQEAINEYFKYHLINPPKKVLQAPVIKPVYTVSRRLTQQVVDSYKIWNMILSFLQPRQKVKLIVMNRDLSKRTKDFIEWELRDI